jgi:hypothetical protein
MAKIIPFRYSAISNNEKITVMLTEEETTLFRMLEAIVRDQNLGTTIRVVGDFNCRTIHF